MQRAYAAHLIQCFMMFHAVSCFVDYFVNSSSFLSVRATLDALWFTGRPVPPESSASEAARFGVEIRDDSRWPWIRRMVRCMADGEVFSSTASTKRGFESGWIFNDLSWILTENQNNNNNKKKTKKEEEGEEEEFRVQVCPKMPPKNKRQVLSLYVPNQAAAFNVEPKEMLSTAWNEERVGVIPSKKFNPEKRKKQKRIFHVCKDIEFDQEKRTKWRTSTSPRCSAYCNALTARLC